MTHLIYTSNHCFKGEIFNSDDALVELKTHNRIFIPASKIRVELRAEKKKLTFLHNTFIKIGTLTAFDQNNPAMFETESVGYALLNLGMGGSIKWSKQMISIGIYANNLLDEKYIDHLSTLKPLNIYNQGRNISVCLKVPFNIKK